MIITRMWDGYQIEVDDISRPIVMFLNDSNSSDPFLAIGHTGALSISEIQKLIEAEQVAIRIASGDVAGLIIRESRA